ncbi:hypothetical protein C7B76_21815 [filamentous cyanobacterium CCP2]|nr:hypothetical protein C7B76_21815 [filamentous cyanobacterium CCP2]
MLSRHKSSEKPLALWYNRIIALIALLNLGLVLFNMSYIPLRDVYLQFIPGLTRLYDPIKGIRPHPSTEFYLNRVNSLEARLRVAGLESPETGELLGDLRRISQQIVANNPFEGAGKSGYLTQINQTINQRVGASPGESGYAQFWSEEYLSQVDWQTELEFFNAELRPLISANYYRELRPYGRFVDRFWIIDLPFMLILGVDFLGRTYLLSRRRPDLNWLEAILRRWHDLFFFLPFWRWLRILPVTLRLYRAELLDLRPVINQINHDFAVGFAQELIEIIGVQVIEQMQASVKRGEVTRWLLEPSSRRPYVQVNNTNEIQAIANRLLNVSVYDVLPQIQPDVEALLHHSLNQTLNQLPAYQQLQHLPGVSRLPQQLTERLAKDLSQAVYGNLVSTLEDPVGAELSARLGKNFRSALGDELQKTHNLQQIQDWLVDLLEEIKLNYVKQVAEGDIEAAVERTEQLRRKSQEELPRG